MKDRYDVHSEEKCGFLISENRKKLWVSELDMLDSLEKICQENNINYFLLFGSAIGAVRHDGFIPWDDDIDIGMLREDFDRFLKCDKSLFGENIDIQYGVYGEEKNVSPLLRIRDKRTTGIIRDELYITGNKGAFIEIYPFDHVNDNLLRKIQIALSKICCSIMCVRKINENSSTFEAVKTSVKRFVCKVISKEKIWNCYEKICKMQDHKSCDYVDTVSLPDYAKTGHHLFKKSDVQETTYHVFEYTTVRIPKGYDAILTTRYGDYMKLPNVSERGMHHNTAVFYDPMKSYIEYEDLEVVRRYFEGKVDPLI